MQTVVSRNRIKINEAISKLIVKTNDKKEKSTLMKLVRELAKINPLNKSISK